MKVGRADSLFERSPKSLGFAVKAWESPSPPLVETVGDLRSEWSV